MRDAHEKQHHRNRSSGESWAKEIGLGILVVLALGSCVLMYRGVQWWNETTTRDEQRDNVIVEGSYQTSVGEFTGNIAPVGGEIRWQGLSLRLVSVDRQSRRDAEFPSDPGYVQIALTYEAKWLGEEPDFNWSWHLGVYPIRGITAPIRTAGALILPDAGQAPTQSVKFALVPLGMQDVIVRFRITFLNGMFNDTADLQWHVSIPPA